MERRNHRVKGLLAAVLICLLGQPVAHASMFTIVSDVAELEGFAPVFVQGGFAVPIDLAEAFGAQVTTDGERYTIAFRGTTVSVREGDERAVTSAGEKLIQPKPFAAAGTLFLPLNFVAEVLRLRVSWNPVTNVITLSPWTSILSAFAAPPQAPEPAATVVPAQPFLIAAPGVQATAALLRTPDWLEIPFIGPGPNEPEPERFAGIWPALFEATGIALWRTVEDGLVTYEFSGEGELSVSTALLVEPPRLVADIAGVESAPGAPLVADPLPIGDGSVRQIRASRTDGGVRLVFDLEEPLGHKLIALDDGRTGVRLLRPFRGVRVDGDADGGRITLDVPPSTPYSISRLVAPDRVVIELYDTTLVTGPLSLEPGGGVVTRVRAAQFLPDVARVVLDVAAPLEIEPQVGGEGLLFVYGDMTGQIAYRTVDSFGVDIRINAGEEAEISVLRLSSPDRLVVDVKPMRLDAPLDEVMIASGPVYRIRASQHDPETVRIVADLKFYAQYALRRDGRQAVLALRQPSLAGRVVSVDPGHGGIDVGAISEKYGLTEKELNLDIALRLGELISRAEGGVHLTRSDDVRIGTSQRDGLMERVRDASQSDSEIFVSIHNNSVLVPSPTARGTETFYRTSDLKSKELAQAVQSSVVSALGTVDRGIVDNAARGYFVLRYIEKPAVLVEVAFLTDPEEEELLAQEWFRQRAAEGIFNGLLKFFHPDDSLDESEVVWPADGSWRRMPPR